MKPEVSVALNMHIKLCSDLVEIAKRQKSGTRIEDWPEPDRRRAKEIFALTELLEEEYDFNPKTKPETMRQISLYEIATADIDQNGVPRPGMETYDHVCRVAKEAVKQALEIAAEEARAEIVYESDIERLIDYRTAKVDKDSILNVIERVK